LAVVWAVLVGLLAGCLPSGQGSWLDPERRGMVCVSETLCLEEPERADEAEALYAEALSFVERRIGPLGQPPRVAFCSTPQCFAQYANPVFSGYSFGQFMVINQKGWEPHILRHEMIHQWQYEQFGALRVARLWPRWYVEGMAYMLSEDPRDELPHPSVQAYRAEFQAWIAAGHDWRDGPYAKLPVTDADRTLSGGVQ